MKNLPKNSTTDRIELLTPAQRRWVALSARVFPGWTARRAEALLLRPPRKRGRAAEVLNAWGQPERIVVDGHRMALWHFGEQGRPRVVLVHGWGGYGGQLAGWIAPLLGAGFAVTLFDQLGHGDSEGQAGALPDFIAGLRTVAAAVPNVVAVVAHSMGAAGALHAVREGLAVDALVLIGSPGNFDLHLKTLSRRVGLGLRAHHSLRGRLERRYRPIAEIDALQGLPVGRTRAMFVHDLDDLEVDFSHLATLHAAWPGSEAMATRGYGHHRVLRAPEVIARSVAFLASASERVNKSTARADCCVAHSLTPRLSI
ncbi:MAG: alpha/beta fold hydrolase [Proteobacteria bacterium]|nr:MAG: alpha/beta fold hydrolase [Pseudomonadota bacterium]